MLNACQTVHSTISPEYDLQTHPLIGKIWSVKQQKFVRLETLNNELLRKNIILLGETHDNARHHQLQAQFVHYLNKEKLANKQQLSLAFEMLEQGQQMTIDTFISENYGQKIPVAQQIDTLEKQLKWQQSGWPDWAYYRPIFSLAVKNQLPILAANAELKQIRQIIKQGASVLKPKEQQRLKKYRYNETLQQKLEQEVQSAHCGMLPEKMLAPMLLGQQSRDLAMTQVLQKSMTQKNQQTILIAGSGHTRTDYGIPFYLRQESPKLSLISIAFIEVSKQKLKAKDYTQAWNQTTQKLPFDYVWFTPRAKRDDQCEKMKAYMSKKH